MINRVHGGAHRHSEVQRHAGHAGHAGCAGCAPCALSQRDCGLQPRVALHALPWVTVPDFSPTPTGLRHSQSATRWPLFKQSGRAKFQVQGDAEGQGRRRGPPAASRMKGNFHVRFSGGGSDSNVSHLIRQFNSHHPPALHLNIKNRPLYKVHQNCFDFG